MAPSVRFPSEFASWHVQKTNSKTNSISILSRGFAGQQWLRIAPCINSTPRGLRTLKPPRCSRAWALVWGHSVRALDFHIVLQQPVCDSTLLHPDESRLLLSFKGQQWPGRWRNRVCFRSAFKAAVIIPYVRCGTMCQTRNLFCATLMLICFESAATNLNWR